MFKSARTYSIFAVIGCLLAVAAGVAGASAGALYRWEVLALGQAFGLLRWAAYGAAVAAAVSLIGLIRARPGSTRRGFAVALAGLCVGAAVFWLPYSQQQTARRVPPIHDITTDTSNPPQFRALVSERPDDANPLEYGGEGLARSQQRAYPDITPVTFDVPPDEVFAEALAVARDMGWHIADSAPAEGRIEAVATTFWFGFKDDVVIRVSRSANGIRVDVRSVSRVGVSDVGENAERIREFLAALKDRV